MSGVLRVLFTFDSEALFANITVKPADTVKPDKLNKENIEISMAKIS